MARHSTVIALLLTRTAAFHVPTTVSTVDISCSRPFSSAANSVVAGNMHGAQRWWRHQLDRSARIHSTSRSTTKLNLFGNLFRDFGTAGGAYNLKIDYSQLEFPGPELGQWAQDGMIPTHSTKYPELELATFAGGCFWGLELAFQRVPGVVYTAAGYTQGKKKVDDYPNYDQVCSGNTGHTEAVTVYYKPEECSYEELLNCFLGRINPTTINGQGRDYGRQYRTGIYAHTPTQLELATARLASEQPKYVQKIATECKPATVFWPAESYHQKYLQKGGRFGNPQSAEKGSTEEIRCYG